MVTKDNQIRYKYFEKPTTTEVTIQKNTAMVENPKIQILSNDLVRRFRNTSQELGREQYSTIIDGYAQKLINSGYGTTQTKKILVNGIRGYHGKVLKCRELGKRLHRTAEESSSSRIKKKLLSKANWFRGSNKETLTHRVAGKGAGQRSMNDKEVTDKKLKTRSVLFVEQTPHGELARQLRELMSRLEPTLGFRIKIVERAGKSLASTFSQASIWEGSHCGRPECITCNQEAEEMPPCSTSSVVYENICHTCNPSALKKGELRSQEGELPSIYVGETSRTVQERGLEHWGAWRRREENGHIMKHQMLHHGGDMEPKFTLKVVGSHKTALSRQIMEAVRIRRRGGSGAILNSKGEFNRAHIPRLVLEDREAEDEELLRKEQKLKNRELDKWLEDWEEDRSKSKEQERSNLLAKLGKPGSSKGCKREQEVTKKQKRSKR